HDEHAAIPGFALDWPIAFHSHDSVDDGEAFAENTMQFDDRPGDSLAVQFVLGPAVNSARNDAEEVLHGKRGAGPVMSLHFRHGNDQIGAKGGVGQENLVEISEFANA